MIIVDSYLDSNNFASLLESRDNATWINCPGGDSSILDTLMGLINNKTKIGRRSIVLGSLYSLSALVPFFYHDVRISKNTKFYLHSPRNSKGLDGGYKKKYSYILQTITGLSKLTCDGMLGNNFHVLDSHEIITMFPTRYAS